MTCMVLYLSGLGRLMSRRYSTKRSASCRRVARCQHSSSLICRSSGTSVTSTFSLQDGWHF